MRRTLQPLAAFLVAWAALAAGEALAGDRHVYLDANNDGILNDCPNPAHNTRGTAGDTSNLKYCNTSTPKKLICDAGASCKSWTITTSACGSANVANLANGVSVDVDGDGAAEPVYAHPQACVYNMAKSDSCEVHAGTYQRAGVECGMDCGHKFTGACHDFNCYKGFVAAFGYGPNVNQGTNLGYGTASNPGYLRGAVMNSSTDTWDGNGNKTPDAAEGGTSYPAIFSGDLNGNGSFDVTSCSAGGGAGSCAGDAFVGVWVGCGGVGSYDIECSTNMTASEHGPRIDSDGNGSFDAEIGRSGAKNVDHFIIKDIKFTKFNGGNGTSDGNARYREAIINLNGNENSDGLKVDHIWMQGNQYALGGGETYWASIADMRNKNCVDYTEIRNSLLYQDNRFIFNDDGTPAPALGCSWKIHDNRIVVDMTRSDSGHSPAIGYFKSLDYHPEDGRPKQVRFYNNEVVVKNLANSGWLFDLQQFGNSGGAAKGQVWVYGNIFRYDPAVGSKLNRLHPIFCSENNNETDRGKWYEFNNTIDGYASGTSIQLAAVCNNAGNLALYVAKNNVYTYATEENITTATTTRISNEQMTDANRCSGTSQYYNCGAAPSYWSGINYYAPKAGGGLTSRGTCDPDGDGVAGVDYDGNGVNDTSWTDLAGNSVSCPNLSATIYAGALQGATVPTDTVPPGTVQGVKRTDDHIP